MVNMHCLARSRGFGFLLHITGTLILACFASISVADAQGPFLSLENVGAFKKVSGVPTPATCGLPARSTFCHSFAIAESLRFCTQRLCVQDCPHRSVPPNYTALLSAGLRSCVAVDERDLRPSTPSNSASLLFGNHRNCFSPRRFSKAGGGSVGISRVAETRAGGCNVSSRASVRFPRAWKDQLW